MAQAGQQPQDHAEQPSTHGVQRSHAGTDMTDYMFPPSITVCCFCIQLQNVYIEGENL